MFSSTSGSFSQADAECHRFFFFYKPSRPSDWTEEDEVCGEHNRFVIGSKFRSNRGNGGAFYDRWITWQDWVRISQPFLFHFSLFLFSFEEPWFELQHYDYVGLLSAIGEITAAIPKVNVSNVNKDVALDGQNS